MPSRALAISSSRHATALTFYVAFGLLGLFHVIGVANHEWVADEWGAAVAALWATLYFAGPILAFAGAFLAPKFRAPVLPLWGEAAGCLLVAATNFSFAYCMQEGLGFDIAATTLTLLTSIGVGMLARFVQIVRDQGRMRAWRAAHDPAQPPT